MWDGGFEPLCQGALFNTYLVYHRLGCLGVKGLDVLGFGFSGEGEDALKLIEGRVAGEYGFTDEHFSQNAPNTPYISTFIIKI